MQEFHIPSSRNATVFYVVTVKVEDDGKVKTTCTCLDWIHRRRKVGTNCKHIRSILT